MRAAITVVSSTLVDLVVPASLILVVAAIMIAGCIGTPGSNTVHRLRAATGGALLEIICIWTAVTAVSSICGHLVVPASPVLVVLGIMVASCIGTPGSSTVYRLGTTTLGALLVVVAVCTAITVVSSIGAVLVESASPVLVV